MLKELYNNWLVEHTTEKMQNASKYIPSQREGSEIIQLIAEDEEKECNIDDGDLDDIDPELDEAVSANIAHLGGPDDELTDLKTDIKCQSTF
jgi:hypothetical protein